MIHFGTVRPGSTLRIPFDSFAAATGAPAALTANAVGDILIYKDSNTTARASTTGYSFNASFSSVTGINELIIDLSSDATADFYKSGSFYYVVVSPVTIDGQTTMAFVAATFGIGYESAVLNTSIATLAGQTSFTLTAGPAEDDALNGMWCLIHDKASAIQTTWACVLDYTGSTKTVTLASVPAATFTIAAIDNISFFGPMPLQPTTMGTKLDVTSGGTAGIDWSNVENPTTTVGLTNTSIITTQKVDVETIKTNPVVNAGTVTFPTNALLASTTNITAGTITTTTNLTNAATAGDFTATMKTSIGTAVAASAVASVTGNVGGNVAGSVGSVTGNVAGSVASVTGAVGSVTGNVGGDVIGDVGNVVAVGAGAINAASFAADVPSLAMRTGTADGGGATTITLDSGASGTNDFYNNTLIYITGNTGAGQSRFISDYVGASKEATVAAWVTQPDNTSTFAILPFDAVAGASAPTAAQVATAVWQDATAGDFTAASSIGKSLYTSGAVPGAAGGVFIAGTNAATTITASLTTTFTGNLTGSVGSVTGAVGSVTGTVGSVTGAVGSVTGNVGGNVAGNLEGTLTATERNAIADATLARSLAAESYAADGAVPTMSQVLYMIQQTIGDFAISGTTISVKKLDGSTEAATYSLDDAVTPTSRTRAT